MYNIYIFINGHVFKGKSVYFSSVVCSMCSFWSYRIYIIYPLWILLQIRMREPLREYIKLFNFFKFGFLFAKHLVSKFE